MESEQQPRLYPGEKLEVAAGFPTLWKYIKSVDPDAENPLVVFTPGAMHNARIAYGGHEGGRQEDFLAHWLSQRGYNFLAVSYPLESNPTLMPAIAPEFGASDWGKQAAEVAYRLIEAEKLSKRVVYLPWSLSGKAIEPFAKEARRLGLTVDLSIPLAATPALSVLRGPPPQFARSEFGYATSPKVVSHFMGHVREQNSLNGDRVIIDERSYMSDYIGGTPDGLRAWGLRYDAELKSFIEDHQAAAQGPDFAALPMIASITGTSALDMRHAIADKASWGFVLTYKLLADVTTHTRSASTSASPDSTAWQQLLALIHSAPELLSVTVPGNHFFFLGEKGARETAEAVIGLIEKAKSLQIQMNDLLAKMYS